MRKLRNLGYIAALFSAAALAQQGSTPAGGGDISKSDMAAHDTATMPNSLDVIRNGIRNNDMDRTAKALRDKLGPARPAKAQEIVAGATVNDNAGTFIAKIDAVEADGVVLSNGVAKVRVPADAFGHNRAGLLLDMTKVQFDKVIAQANAGH
jgi:hypothetical protein